MLILIENGLTTGGGARVGGSVASPSGPRGRSPSSPAGLSFPPSFEEGGRGGSVDWRAASRSGSSRTVSRWGTLCTSRDPLALKLLPGTLCRWRPKLLLAKGTPAAEAPPLKREGGAGTGPPPAPPHFPLLPPAAAAASRRMADDVDCVARAGRRSEPSLLPEEMVRECPSDRVLRPPGWRREP